MEEVPTQSIPSASFEQDIISRLSKRDNRENNKFAPIIEEYQRLCFHDLRIHDRIAEIEFAYSELNNRYKTISSENELLRKDGSPFLKEKLDELERKCELLKEEKAELVKGNSLKSSRLLELSDELKMRETKLRIKEAEIKVARQNISELSANVSDLSRTVSDREGTIKILNEELQSLGSSFNTVNQRNKLLEEENKILVDRWLRKMNEEAQKMNAANEFYNSVLSSSATVSHSRASSSSTNNPQEFVDVEANDVLERSLTIRLPSSLSRTVKPYDTSDITCLEIGNEGALLATGSKDSKIKLLDTKTGDCISTLQGSTKSINSIHFSSHDDMIVVTCTDNVVRIWNTETGKIRHTITGHMSNALSAKFLPDSQRVISSSGDRTIKIWDIQRDFCLKTIFSFSASSDLAHLDSSGNLHASGHFDGAIRIWDSRSGECVKDLKNAHSAAITSLVSFSDNRCILSLARDNTLNLIDSRVFSVIQSFEQPDFVTSTFPSNINPKACISPDSSYVAAGSTSGSIFFWRTLNGSLARKVDLPDSTRTLPNSTSAPIFSVQWHPLGGSQVYSASSSELFCWE